MRVEITVEGGIGELALEAVGLQGADLTRITTMNVDANHLQAVLRRLTDCRLDVISVSPCPS